MQEKPKLGRVLIVEDDRKTADALVLGLERGGYETILARSGEVLFSLCIASIRI